MYMMNSVIIVGRVNEIMASSFDSQFINFSIETETAGKKFTFEIRHSGLLAVRMIKAIKKDKLVRIVGRLETDVATKATYVFAEHFCIKEEK